MRPDIAKLLGRGGRVLGLSAVAHARGQGPGEGPWHVLSTETVAAAEQILAVLEQAGDQESVAAAVGTAMGSEPCTAAPSWAAPAWDRQGMIEQIGAGLDRDAVAAALGIEDAGSGARTVGLAAFAIAMCRSIDGARAFGEKLGKGDGDAVVRMARLAQARVAGGEPSQLRARLKRAIADEVEADG